MIYLGIWLVTGCLSLIICVFNDGVNEPITFENFVVAVVIVVFGPFIGLLVLYLRQDKG